jgi:hypothetical protein
MARINPALVITFCREAICSEIVMSGPFHGVNGRNVLDMQDINGFLETRLCLAYSSSRVACQVEKIIASLPTATLAPG